MQKAAPLATVSESVRKNWYCGISLLIMVQLFSFVAEIANMSGFVSKEYEVF